jgi:hypothetical protein
MARPPEKQTMTITKVDRRRRPDTVCAAKLHLDEVQQITEILASAGGDTERPHAEIKYRVGDTECETIDELHGIGGRTNSFEISVKRDDLLWPVRLLVTRYDTTLYLDALKEDQFWIKYGQIRDIFESNSIWWTNAIRAVLDRIAWWVWIPWTVFWIAYLLPKDIQHNQTHPSHWLIDVFVCLVTALLLFRHSVVILNWSREKGLRKWFQTHGTQVALLIVGALLGAFAKAILDHVWPNH